MSVSVFWSLCQSHCVEVSHLCQCILVTMSVILYGGQSLMLVYFGHYVSHIVWRSVTYVSQCILVTMSVKGVYASHLSCQRYMKAITSDVYGGNVENN